MNKAAAVLLLRQPYFVDLQLLENQFIEYGIPYNL